MACSCVLSDSRLRWASWGPPTCLLCARRATGVLHALPQLILTAPCETSAVTVLQKRDLTLRESQWLHQGVTATLKAMVSL